MASDFDLKALYVELDNKRSGLGLTWAGVAREIEAKFAKVSPSTIKGVANRARVEGDGVLQMLLWLDRAPESFVPGFFGLLTRLSPARRGKILRWDAAKIFALLDESRREKGLSWKDLAGEIGGVTDQQLTSLSKGGRVFLPEAMRVVNWLGIPASNLTKESAT